MSIDRDGDGPPLRRPDGKVSLTPSDARGGDLRATPFTDDVFTDDYYGRRPAATQGGKSFSVLIGVTLGVIVAAGAGWYFLHGTGVTFTPGGVGFIKADPTPYKIRPDNPGGMQVENQDKLVYDRVAKGNAPNRVENLLPAPEEPKAPPPKPVTEAPAPEPAKVEPAKVEPLTPEPAKAEVAKVEAPKPEPVKVEPPKPEPAKPEPAKVEAPAKPAEPEPDPLAAAVAAATVGRTSATGPITVTPAPAPASTPAPVATSPAEPQMAAAVPNPAPAAAAAAGGSFQIQLASVLSEEAALAEWKRISSKHSDLLGSYTPAVTKADLGERGVFYRLRAGSFPGKAAANALCASLAAVNVGCIVPPR